MSTEKNKQVTPSCPLCLATITQHLDTYTAPGYEIYHCLKCNIIFSDPIHNAGQDWYETSDWYSFGSPVKEVRWHEQVFLKRRPHYGNNRLLNIGCGKTIFLRDVENAGYKVVAVDFNEKAVQFTKDKLGIENAIAADIMKFSENYIGEKFDIIVAFEVFEHLSNPRDVIVALIKMLNPGGYMVISIPNRNRLWPQRNHWDYPPHHMTRWNDSCLKNFMERHGLTVEHVEKKPIADDDMLWITRWYFSIPQIEKSLDTVTGMPQLALKFILEVLLLMRISIHTFLAILANLITSEGTNIIAFARSSSSAVNRQPPIVYHG
jgi:SAM-dependent methyltransferase